MTAATILAAGIVIGIFTADVLHYAANRAFAWMAARIDGHVTAALEADDDEDPLEQAWRLDPARKPAA